MFAYLEMLFDAATDQIDSLGKLLEGERLSWFGHLPLARAAVEASARMWQIADPAIDARERVRVGSAANVWGRSTCWVKVFQSDRAFDDPGTAAMLAAWDYSRFSAVAHGLPGGVSMYRRPPDADGGHAHNVFTAADVGGVVLAALTAYEAGVDRLAAHFRWKTPDLTPLRWSAHRQVSELMRTSRRGDDESQ